MVDRPNRSFKDARTLLAMVDKIRPNRSTWVCEQKTIQGDAGEDGETMTEDIESWFRNIMDVLQELGGRADLDPHFRNAPERAFADTKGQQYIIDESWLARWWWDMQVIESCVPLEIMLISRVGQAGARVSKGASDYHARSDKHRRDSVDHVSR